jgi:hypothetical protein
VTARAARLLLVVTLVLGAAARVLAAPLLSESEGGSERQLPPEKSLQRRLELASEDPTAPIKLLIVHNSWIPQQLDGRGNLDAMVLQMTHPIDATRSFPLQIARAKVLFVALPDGHKALGDLELADVVQLGHTEWGRWGAGGTVILPTANTRQTGLGKVQVGPAFAITYWGIRKWRFTFIVQNPISVAGDPTRRDVSALWVQPAVTCALDNGWYLISNPQIVHDWNSHSWIVPLNIGLGRVFRIRRQVVNVSIQPEWTFLRTGRTTASRFILKLNWGIVLP